MGAECKATMRATEEAQKVVATMYVRIKLRDRKALAALGAIRAAAESIRADQPWNDDAKRIERLATRLLRRMEIRRQK